MIAVTDKTHTVTDVAVTTHAHVTASAKTAVLVLMTTNVLIVAPTPPWRMDAVYASKTMEDHAARTTSDHVIVVAMVATAHRLIIVSAVVYTLIVMERPEPVYATMTSAPTMVAAALFVKSHVHQAV